MGSNRILALVALFLAVQGNLRFFRETVEVYPWRDNLLSLLSLFLVIFASLFLVLRLLSIWKVKPVLILSLLVSAFIGYFSLQYGTVFDQTMIRNILRTDKREVLDLFSPWMLAYFALFGLLPSIFVWKWREPAPGFRKKGREFLFGAGASLLLIVVCVAPSGRFYASFLREHKSLRTNVNPVYFYYSAGKTGLEALFRGHSVFSSLGLDARVPASDEERELVIFVLGETARGDHFSLNGYARQTNPLLADEELISFSDLSSCGTSTAVSVPCMFSSLGRNGFSETRARSMENLLDVLAHTGKVNVLWRDNNSDSKGVALRVPFQDFRDPAPDRNCEEECRDTNMLLGLQQFVDAHPHGDFFIVLHQMGSHGPAYYKRYPRDFEKFRPACRSADLGRCSQEEIVNAYDNTILYTDFFLSRVIGFLKKNSDKFEASMLYVSDHGESLGENGLYLHGLPYLVAPEAQKKVAAVLWMNDAMKEDLPLDSIRRKAREPLSHDYLFHSLLGLMEVESSVYRKELDFFHP